MSLAFEFHPEADDEFDADVFWYEDREPGLGRRFRRQAGAAIEAVSGDPDAWPPWPGWDREPLVRSKRVEGFPYRVDFVIRDVVTIVAVAHQKR